MMVRVVAFLMFAPLFVVGTWAVYIVASLGAALIADSQSDRVALAFLAALAVLGVGLQVLGAED